MKTRSGIFIPIIAAAAAVILSVIRFFQYMSLMDFSTGYFLKGSEFGGVLIYICMCAFAAIFIAVSVILKKKGPSGYTVASDGMGSHATQFLGFSELIAAVLTMLPIFTGKLETFRFIGTTIAALALLVSGFLLLRNIVPPAATGHLKLILTVYLFIRSAEVFNSDLIVLNHSDKLIELIASMASMAFMASLARFYARVETKRSRIREIIFAGITVIASGTHIIPKLLAYMFGGDVTAGMSGINTDVAACFIMSVVFLFVVFCTDNRKEIEFVDIYEEEKEKRKRNNSLKLK